MLSNSWWFCYSSLSSCLDCLWLDFFSIVHIITSFLIFFILSQPPLIFFSIDCYLKYHISYVITHLSSLFASVKGFQIMVRGLHTAPHRESRFLRNGRQSQDPTQGMSDCPFVWLASHQSTISATLLLILLVMLMLFLFDVQHLTKTQTNTNYMYTCILQIVGTLDPRFHDLVKRAEAERMTASTSFSTSDESDLIQVLTFDPSPHTGQHVTL